MRAAASKLAVSSKSCEDRARLCRNRDGRAHRCWWAAFSGVEQQTATVAKHLLGKLILEQLASWRVSVSISAMEYAGSECLDAGERSQSAFSDMDPE